MAALTIKQFNKRVSDLISDAPSALLDILEENALTAKAEVNKRIVETGKDSSGKNLPEYTPAYLRFKKDVGRYRGVVDLQLGNYSINKRIDAVQKRKAQRARKVRKAGGKSKFKRLTKEELKTLKSNRRAKAIPQGAKLWESIQLKSKTLTGKSLIVVVAPIDDINVKKSQGLSKKRGDFLALSEKEQFNLKLRFEEQFGNYVVKKLRK